MAKKSKPKLNLVEAKIPLQIIRIGHEPFYICDPEAIINGERCYVCGPNFKRHCNDSTMIGAGNAVLRVCGRYIPPK